MEWTYLIKRTHLKPNFLLITTQSPKTDQLTNYTNILYRYDCTIERTLNNYKCLLHTLTINIEEVHYISFNKRVQIFY